MPLFFSKKKEPRKPSNPIDDFDPAANPAPKRRASAKLEPGEAQAILALVKKADTDGASEVVKQRRKSQDIGSVIAPGLNAIDHLAMEEKKERLRNEREHERAADARRKSLEARRINAHLAASKEKRDVRKSKESSEKTDATSSPPAASTNTTTESPPTASEEPEKSHSAPLLRRGETGGTASLPNTRELKKRAADAQQRRGSEGEMTPLMTAEVEANAAAEKAEGIFMRVEDYVDLMGRLEKLTLSNAAHEAKIKKNEETADKLRDAYREKHGEELEQLIGQEGGCKMQ